MPVRASTAAPRRDAAVDADRPEHVLLPTPCPQPGHHHASRYVYAASDTIHALAAKVIGLAPDLIATVPTPEMLAVKKVSATVLPRPAVSSNGDPLGAGV